MGSKAWNQGSCSQSHFGWRTAAIGAVDACAVFVVARIVERHLLVVLWIIAFSLGEVFKNQPAQHVMVSHFGLTATICLPVIFLDISVGNDFDVEAFAHEGWKIQRHLILLLNLHVVQYCLCNDGDQGRSMMPSWTPTTLTVDSFGERSGLVEIST